MSNTRPGSDRPAVAGRFGVASALTCYGGALAMLCATAFTAECRPAIAADAELAGPSMPADPDVAALLHKLEQQVFAGHVTTPPFDNAVATWQAVAAKTMLRPISPGVAAALADFIAEAKSRSAKPHSAGDAIVATDLLTFANMAAESLKRAQSTAAIIVPPAPSPHTTQARILQSASPPATSRISPAMPSIAIEAPAASPAPRQPPAAAKPAPNPPAAPNAALAETYLARGKDMLAIKDISAARKYFEFAADAGSAPAAAAMARTYDPNYLLRLGVVGVQPDAALATAWYRKATAMGDANAPIALRALDALATR